MRFLLTASVICFFTTASIAQNAIGGSYGLRLFPFQERNPYTYHDYNNGKAYPTDYSVTLTKAPEHVTNLFFEHFNRSGKRALHVGLNTYSTVMNFEKESGESKGNGGVNGVETYYDIYRQRGRYTYTFVGLELGTTYYKQLGSGNFSFIQGFLASANALANQKTYNKEYTHHHHYGTTIFTGPYAGTYSTDTMTRTTDVDDLKINSFNIRVEYIIGFSHRENGNQFSFTVAIGASTQSRILNPANFNLYLCPRFSYTRTLNWKSKPVNAAATNL